MSTTLGSKGSSKLSRLEKNAIKEAKKIAKLQKLKENNFPNFPEPKNIISPQVAKFPIEEQIPKNIQNPEIYKTMTAEFYYHKKDIKGIWSWGLTRIKLDEDFNSIILPYTNHPKTTKWGTLLLETHMRKGKAVTNHHHIAITSLSEEVQQRWDELELHFSEVFTFRISGKKRLWGYRIVNKYFLIWWDPKHEILPLQ